MKHARTPDIIATIGTSVAASHPTLEVLAAQNRRQAKSLRGIRIRSDVCEQQIRVHTAIADQVDRVLNLIGRASAVEQALAAGVDLTAGTVKLTEMFVALKALRDNHDIEPPPSPKAPA